MKAPGFPGLLSLFPCYSATHWPGMFTTVCFFFQFVLCWPTIFDTLPGLRGWTFINRKMKKKGCFGLRMDNLSPPSTDWTQRAYYPRLTDCFSLCTCHPAFVYNVRYRVIFCARARACWVWQMCELKVQLRCSVRVPVGMGGGLLSGGGGHCFV